ncbi:MAG: nuclear transport factor 2 family protein [bacterium]|nr:nuclear transport factor 2 family protein [bacterium]
MNVDTGRRREILEAYSRHAEARRSFEWRALADLFAVDARYFDPIFGWQEGREQIRAFLAEAARGLAEREFRECWHVVDDDRVVLYWHCVRPGETTESGRPRYHGMSSLRYAGEGLWAEQMDIYDQAEARGSREAARLD